VTARVGFIALLFLLAACSAEHVVGNNIPAPVDVPDIEEAQADAGQNEPVRDGGPFSASDAGFCSTYVALAGADEIATTPRADKDLELLALTFSDGLVAEQPVYDRVVADVASIRAADPTLVGINHSDYGGGTSVLVYFDDQQVAARVKAGTFHEWDCLNQYYGAKAPLSWYSDGPSEYSVILDTKGLYNLTLLAQEYAKVPGVKKAQPFSGIGFAWEHPAICATRDGQRYQYLFKNGYVHSTAAYSYYESEPGQAPVLQGTWSQSSGHSMPSWVYPCGTW
jgi:hypothetical protein